MKNQLFLHMGPGGNPEVDKNWLKDQNIDFLQIPYALESDEDYMPVLIEWCRQEIQARLKAADNIEVIAHSFGAFLLNEQSQILLDQISKITFISPTFNFFRSLTQLFNFGLTHSPDSKLEAKLAHLKKNPQSDLFWDFFGEFIKIYPDYMRLYFYREDIYEKFKKSSEESSELHELSLIKGVNELVEGYNFFPFQVKKYSQAQLILGEYDPLIPKEDQTLLTTFFGHEQVRLFKCGHFPHLEMNLTF